MIVISGGGGRITCSRDKGIIMIVISGGGGRIGYLHVHAIK